MAYDAYEVWDRYFNKYPKKVTQRNQNGLVLRGKDYCGAIMDRAALGRTSRKNNFGWEVDHIVPEARIKSGEFSGNPDHPDNLRPMQWANNRAKGDALDNEGWQCATVAS